MMTKGSQSIAFQEAPYIISSGSVVGKKEGEGPLGKLFDMVEMENLFGEDTWEAAESTMQKEACLFGGLEKQILRWRKSDISLEEIYCVRELLHPWEWRRFRFRCSDFMEPVLHQERQSHWER